MCSVLFVSETDLLKNAPHAGLKRPHWTPFLIMINPTEYVTLGQIICISTAGRQLLLLTLSLGRLTFATAATFGEGGGGRSPVLRTKSIQSTILKIAFYTRKFYYITFYSECTFLCFSVVSKPVFCEQEEQSSTRSPFPLSSREKVQLLGLLLLLLPEEREREIGGRREGGSIGLANSIRGLCAADAVGAGVAKTVAAASAAAVVFAAAVSVS